MDDALPPTETKLKSTTSSTTGYTPSSTSQNTGDKNLSSYSSKGQDMDQQRLPPHDHRASTPKGTSQSNMHDQLR